MKLIPTPEQYAAFTLLEDTNENYFITGKAGTGKSVLLRYFVEHTKKKVAVCAPTGIAAVNVGGQTMHSLFHLSLHEHDSRKSSSLVLNDAGRELLSRLDCIIIDEASMIRSDTMDLIDKKLRFARGKADKVFGGCQILLFGDLYQLSPVTADDGIEDFILDRFGGFYFFHAPAVQEHPFRIIELTQIHRQKDDAFIGILNKVRLDIVDKSSLAALNARRVDVPPEVHAVTLTSLRTKADEVNSSKLDALPGEIFCYTASYTGDFERDIAALNAGGYSNKLPADYQLRLKIGAQVMMIRNDVSAEHRWVNGTIGIIDDLTERSIIVSIDGRRHIVEPEEWQQYQYSYDRETQEVKHEITGTFCQYPIKLAYAMTIHKSQGQTYDTINIDLSGSMAFAAGQIYVALSRCKTLDGVYLTRPLLIDEVISDPGIVRYLSTNPSVDLKEVAHKKANEYRRRFSVSGEIDTAFDPRPDEKTSPLFLSLLKSEPYFRSGYFEKLRALPHTRRIDPYLDLMEQEVRSYRHFCRELLRRKDEYPDYKELLIRQNRVYCLTINYCKEIITGIISAL